MLNKFVPLTLVVCLSLAAQEQEPIAYVGHGALFDQKGQEIEVTPEFALKAQTFYRNRLYAALSSAKKEQYTKFEGSVLQSMRVDGRERIAVQQRLIGWLAKNADLADGKRTQSKVNALAYALQVRLGMKLDPKIEERIKALEPPSIVFFSTINSGQAYINECAAAGVPIPPPIGQLDPMGTNGWKSQGFIPKPDLFIVTTKPAEVRTYKSTSPAGMCIALPRYLDDSKAQVFLDGVICIGQVSSKVCFWDNQMSGSGFTFNTGDRIPIGVPDLAVDPMGRYQAGGFELEGGSGGACTECHAGENPYIVHPDVDLGGGNLFGDLNGPPQNLPTFGATRYDPIVPASWWQNDKSQTPAYVPPGCVGCHSAGSVAGRFPHLSNIAQLAGYCGTILPQAINRTMPPGAPGSLKNDATVQAFQAWCNSAPTSGPSDRGDPHLTTTNGIHYDFQSAGEFVTLRDSDTRFELQTRQSPVSTTFVPGPNDYTGLASCVSLNTAAALRVGRHRITLQPAGGQLSSRDRLQLRVDGALTTLPAGGMSLGGGNFISTTSLGGLDVRADDGTRVVITPEFWTSQGYWYLNVEVLDTPAREGTMGPIVAGNFLPLGPNGVSFGPKPASLGARHTLLNQTFANAWRVTNRTSLFDYAPGTSTATFTDAGWPPPPGAAGPCKATLNDRPPIEPMARERAIRLCSVVRDKAANADCEFDLIAMNEPSMVKAYLDTLQGRDRAVTSGTGIGCVEPARVVLRPSPPKP